MGWKVFYIVTLLTLWSGASVAREKTEELSRIDQLRKQVGQLYKQGNYAEAANVNHQVLTIRERVLGADHPDTATSLHLQAFLYVQMKEYKIALPLQQRALVILERALGPDHPDVAANLNNLATILFNLKQHMQALPLYQRALAIREKTLGPDHIDNAITFDNLGELYENWNEPRI